MGSSPDDARPREVTRILAALREGEPRAADELLPVVYEELRGIARRGLAGERAGQTLQATALVHEAWLRLGGGDSAAQDWENRRHFFAAAAQAMRRILVDRARRRGRDKRGGGRRRVDLSESVAVEAEPSLDLVALDAALEELETHDERKFKVVMLRYFTGLSIEETAEALEVSPATVKTDWSYARAWLHRELAGGAAEGSDGGVE